MTPLAAYHHLAKVLEQVNAVQATLFNADAIADAERRDADIVEMPEDDKRLSFISHVSIVFLFFFSLIIFLKRCN